LLRPGIKHLFLSHPCFQVQRLLSLGETDNSPMTPHDLGLLVELLLPGMLISVLVLGTFAAGG